MGGRPVLTQPHEPPTERLLPHSTGEDEDDLTDVGDELDTNASLLGG
jgi:hypothetical protein